MTPKQEKAFCQAMTKTLWAYENLIQNPGKYRGEWYSWGESKNCRICAVFGAMYLEDTCEPCPLFNCAGQTFEDLSCVFENEANDTELRRAARARYKWLIQKIEENGYEYR